MEANRKRPKVMVRLVNNKCIILNRKNDENAPVSLPAVNEPTLHPHLLQNLQLIQNVSSPAHKTKDVATQTGPSESELENNVLQTILLKLNSMESNHHTQMAEANKQIRLLRAQIDLLTDRIMPRPGLVTATDFEWEPIGTKEDLERFEDRLKETNYKTSLKAYLENLLESEGSEARLHDSMDVIFKRDFVTKLSWTGGGKPVPKIRFLSFTNILKLYKDIGTCHGIMPTDKKLKDFFQNKFKHGGQRLNLTGTMKSTFHKHMVQKHMVP